MGGVTSVDRAEDGVAAGGSGADGGLRGGWRCDGKHAGVEERVGEEHAGQRLTNHQSNVTPFL